MTATCIFFLLLFISNSLFMGIHNKRYFSRMRLLRSLDVEEIPGPRT